MRQVVLDTETTGLNARLGDRVIEIGCVELAGRRFTGNDFHGYINPERRSEAGALEVHGISDDFLQDKPKFAEVAPGFLEYIAGAELVIHNAEFDVEFLNLELERLRLPPLERHCAGIFDTLKLAKQLYPGKRNSLDALCERHQVDNSHRTLHGALLDATLLAEVYLAMTRGQESLAIDLDSAPAARDPSPESGGERSPLVVLHPAPEELAEHEKVLAAIEKESRGNCVWLRLEGGT